MIFQHGALQALQTLWASPLWINHLQIFLDPFTKTGWKFHNICHVLYNFDNLYSYNTITHYNRVVILVYIAIIISTKLKEERFLIITFMFNNWMLSSEVTNKASIPIERVNIIMVYVLPFQTCSTRVEILWYTSNTCCIQSGLLAYSLWSKRSNIR